MHPPARSVTLNNQQINMQDLKEIQDLPEKRREGRAQEIMSGADFLQRSVRFPSRRPCVDLPWAILFLLTVLALIIFLATSAGEFKDLPDLPSQPRALAFHSGYMREVDQGGSIYEGQELGVSRYSDSSQAGQSNPSIKLSDSQARQLLANICLAGIAGAVGGLLSAALWILAAKACASVVVYTSLVAVPSLFIVLGLAVALAGSVPSGLMICGFGVLCLTLVLWCWARYIPFTIEIAQMVSHAFSQRPEMVAISVLGGFLGPIWFILVMAGYAACELKVMGGDVSDYDEEEGSNTFYPFLFIFLWGSFVIHNICHVAYCGVFSRWYFQEEGSPLLKSLQVALVSSFGSICQGTLIIAAIQTLEQVVRSSRNQAAEDGNVVGFVVAMVLECILSCLGDLMEYFSQWVFVMCAIRGGSFCDSVRGTCALVSCTGMKAVIGDLLIDSVVRLGCFLSALGGCALAALASLFTASDLGQQLSQAEVIGICSLVGLLSALISGGGVMAIMSSGTKAILMCWAEDPDRLHQEHGFEDLHAELNNKAREWR